MFIYEPRIDKPRINEPRINEPRNFIEPWCSKGTAHNHDQVTEESCEGEGVDLSAIQRFQISLAAEKVHSHIFYI